MKRLIRFLLTRLGFYKYRQIVRISNMPSLLKKRIPGNFVCTHVSSFNYGNTGDLYLPVILRDLFNAKIGICKWYGKHVHKIVTDEDLRTYNRSDFVLIGGGGLFLKDTNPNDLSGWQWSCDIEHLKRIKKPIIMFAVGYNRFRGQEDFDPIFKEHINLFVEKAEFIGLRNHGSIESIKSYLDNFELKKKLVFQPCMTTLTSCIYPYLEKYDKKENCIAFNCAFDRSELRKNNEKILEAIAKVALALSKDTKIRYYSHVISDEQILPYFDAIGVKYELVHFHTVRDIVREYTKPRLVIGMRGHAQMIPFGCNTPILSIISHDKMKWFLDDIHHPEWGVDVLEPNFEELLLQKAKKLYMETDSLFPILVKEQQYLNEITIDNIAKIRTIIKK